MFKKENEFSIINSAIILGFLAIILFSLLVYHITDENKISTEEKGKFAKTIIQEIKTINKINSIFIRKDLTLWTLSDIVLTNKSNINNTIAFTKSENYNDAIFYFYRENGDIANIIKNNKNFKFEINDGIKIGEKVFIYYSKNDISSNKHIDSGILILNIDDKWNVGDKLVFEIKDKIFNECCGESVTEKDEYIYIIMRDSSKIKIAKVNRFEILNRNAYRFLNDNYWAKNIESARNYFSNSYGNLSMKVDKNRFVFFYFNDNEELDLVSTENLSTLNNEIHNIIYTPKKIEIKYYYVKEMYKDDCNFYLTFINPFIKWPILLEVEKQFEVR